VVYQCHAIQGGADEGSRQNIRNHFDGIVAWHRLDKPMVSSKHSMVFQAAKRKARGYTSIHTMRTVIFLIAGKLIFQSSTLMPLNPFVFQKSLIN